MHHRYAKTGTTVWPAVIVLFCLTFSAAQPGRAWAQVRVESPVPITRIDGPITLDGRLDEAAWEAVPPLQMVMYQPTYEGEPSERTDVRVAYDDDYLYVGGRLYEDHPGAIRANSMYRDRYSGDDTFAIIIDPFDDNENTLWFFTTPFGVRNDMSVANDGEGGYFAVNPNWNTYWDVGTRITDEGWFAEVRIPFSSLGFQDDDGRVVMGLTVYRYVAHNNERYVYPPIPPNWDMGFAKASQAQDVVLTGVHSQRPIYVTPYALGGLAQHAALNDAQTLFETNDDFTREVGLDVKYSLTSNLTLDLTANTDFAQVEADDQQVNLGRFSLFFPEKRQFFQERSAIFAFDTGGQSRLFHSRRIGLVSGEPIRILGGARTVGRLGDWDLGFLDMQTARADGIPSENFGVLRLRRNVLNANTYVGGMMTSRLGDDGSYNVAYGLDGIVRVFGDDYLTVKWAQTFDDAVIDAHAFDFGAAGLFRAEWQRRGQQGFTYGARVGRSGAQYDPGIGFVLRRDFTEVGVDGAYGWFAGEASPIRKMQPSVSASVFLRNADGSVESFQGSLPWSVELKSGARMSAAAHVYYEDLLEPLVLPEDAFVPAGSYSFYGVAGSYNAQDGLLFRPSASVGILTFYDGWRFDLGFGPVWNVSRYLELGVNYNLNLVRFPDRDQRFDVHIARLRAQVALNTKVSATAFVQYNNVARAAITNVRFRYNFREGNDLWIVYNEGMNTDRDRAVPTLPITDARSVLVKYTYTFGL